jgi:hypothetical protein
VLVLIGDGLHEVLATLGARPARYAASCSTNAVGSSIGGDEGGGDVGLVRVGGDEERVESGQVVVHRGHEHVAVPGRRRRELR